MVPSAYGRRTRWVQPAPGQATSEPWNHSANWNSRPQAGQVAVGMAVRLYRRGMWGINENEPGRLRGAGPAWAMGDVGEGRHLTAAAAGSRPADRRRPGPASGSAFG